MDNVNRLEKLYAAIEKEGLEALVLNPSPTQYYISDLHLGVMERPMCLFLVPGETPVLVLPELEKLKLQEAAIPLKGFTYGAAIDSWQKAFDQAAAALPLNHKRIGVEPTHMRFLEMSYLRSAIQNPDFVSAEDIIAQVRMAKDETEKANMQKAVDIAQSALTQSLPLFKIGMTEIEAANEFGMQVMRAGGQGMSFTPILSAGPNSANPHAVPTQRKLQTGDLLVIDFGARYNGYCSDITRTFGVGPVDEELQKIHKITQDANAAARAAVRPGVRAGDIDLAARTVITDAGYGEYFTHRVGHGLGLEGHEPPYMHGANQLILKPGFTFTIEPGIYLPDYGGVRVEDDVMVTEDGVYTFSSLPRELITICE